MKNRSAVRARCLWWEGKLSTKDHSADVQARLQALVKELITSIEIPHIREMS